MSEYDDARARFAAAVEQHDREDAVAALADMRRLNNELELELAVRAAARSWRRCRHHREPRSS